MLLLFFGGGAKRLHANPIHFEMHPVWIYMFYEANSKRLVVENASWAEICIRYW